MKKVLLVLATALISFQGFSQLVWSDVAGIFHNRCVTCHRPNGGGPFPLMYYSEAATAAPLIQTMLGANKMPPWPPDTTYTRFLHERLITATEKANILSWISTGTAQGDTTLAPVPPTFPQYKLLGTPTMTLQIPTFVSNATPTTDAYNCFSVSANLSQDQYLRAFEVVPGNPNIVHHVVITCDTMGSSTNNLSGTCYSQAGDFEVGGYAPGAMPTVFPGQAPLKTGMRIKAGSKFVVQIHYPAGTQGQTDSTKIRMYYYPVNETGIRPMFAATPLQNWSLIIPANTVQTFNASYGPVPLPLSIFAVFPHSHKVCTTAINYATSPVDTVELIRINRWDFMWQGFYTYRFMPTIPTGYTLRSRHVYDNTTNNPNNPNSPPQLVTAGFSTGDEMLFDAIMFLFYQTGDENIDIGVLQLSDSLLFSVAEMANPLSSLASPNPFTNETNIGFILKNSGKVQFNVYDIYGKLVFNSAFNGVAGANDVKWSGEGHGSGMYIYSITSGDMKSSGRIIKLPAR